MTPVINAVLVGEDSVCTECDYRVLILLDLLSPRGRAWLKLEYLMSIGLDAKV